MGSAARPLQWVSDQCGDTRGGGTRDMVCRPASQFESGPLSSVWEDFMSRVVWSEVAVTGLIAALYVVLLVLK